MSPALAVTRAFVAGLGVPPPTTMASNRTAAWVFTGFCIGMFAAVACWAVWMLAKRRSPLPLCLLVGGALCSLVEPIADIIGLTWYPIDSPLIVYTAWGRPIPSWVPLGEGMFFALAGYGAYVLMRDGRSVRTLLVLMLAFSAFDSIMEMVSIQEHVWIYYGNNPSRVFGLPLYSIVQNGGLAIVVGWVALVSARHLRGAAWLALPPLIPCVFLAQAAACTWPAYTALNSGWSTAAAVPVLVVATVLNFVLPYALLHTDSVARLRTAGAVEVPPQPAGRLAEAAP